MSRTAYRMFLATTALFWVGCSVGSPATDRHVFGSEHPDGDGGVCATRSKRYTIDTRFPFQAVSDSDKPLAECIPSCGMQRERDGVLSIESLPAGACSTERPCDMGAYELCGCDDTQRGAVSNFRCSCKHGAWACAYIAQGAGICVCDVPDASSATETDSGSGG
jgi:hypothetical protein